MNKIIDICKRAIQYNTVHTEKLYFIDLISYNYGIGFLNYLNDVYYDLFNSEKYYMNYEINSKKLIVSYTLDITEDQILLSDNLEEIKNILKDYYMQSIQIIKDFEIN